MDIVAQIEELKREIAAQRAQVAEDWKKGSVDIDTLIQNLSKEDEE
jgi:predicted Holliday junction resolvase-like endonuclease